MGPLNSSVRRHLGFMVIRAIAFSLLLSAMHLGARASEFEVGPFCGPDNPDPPACVDALVADWKMRDGAAFWDVGSALAESFCAHPRLVLTRLSQQPAVLDSWVGTLPESTFFVFDHADTTFGTEATEHLLSLKACMLHGLSTLVDDPEVGVAARHMFQVVQNTQVSYVD